MTTDRNLITKQEAADIVGCSLRTFESYQSQSLIKPADFTKGKRGQLAMFDLSEVEKLKRDLEQKRKDKAAGIAQIDKAASGPLRSIADSPEAKLITFTPEALREFTNQLITGVIESLPERLLLSANNRNGDNAANPDEFLSVKDAAIRRGLSERFLRKAGREGKLNIYHLPSVRGNRVSLRELDAYIASLDLSQFVKTYESKAKAAKAHSD